MAANEPTPETDAYVAWMRAQLGLPKVAGPTGAGATSPLVALRDVAQGVPAAVAADPSRRQALAALLADARASANAGDVAAATPKIEALRQAIAAPAGPGAGPAIAQPPPADGAPGLSAGERMAAMQAGMEQGQAGGTRGGVQVAAAGPPPGTATDPTGSVAETPAGGPSLLGRMGGFLADHAPTGRQLYGVGETTVAAGGMVLSGIGVAAGVAETGVGVLATPAGGAGIPVAAGGVALTGGSLALGGMSADLFGRGLGDVFSRPPPVASSPVPQGPAGAVPSLALPNGDAPPDGLAGARVDPGLGGQMQRAMQDRIGAPRASGTFRDGAGTIQVRLGESAMSDLPPGLQGIQGDPGLVPPSPLSGQLPGFDPPDAGVPHVLGGAPPAAVPTSTATPIPEPVRGSNVLPGATIQPARPQIVAMARPKPNKAELEKQKAIIKARELPTGGSFPYVPPKTWASSQPLPRGPNRGYLDVDGAEWIAPRGQILGPRHWDVQKPGGGHRNVTTEGEIDHG